MLCIPPHAAPPAPKLSSLPPGSPVTGSSVRPVSALCPFRVRPVSAPQVLDWEDALPEDELALAEKFSREADLNLTLVRNTSSEPEPQRFPQRQAGGLRRSVGRRGAARRGAAHGELSGWASAARGLKGAAPSSPPLRAQGTSLQITPACNIPLKNLGPKRNGKLAIVNLQARAPR